MRLILSLVKRLGFVLLGLAPAVLLLIAIALLYNHLTLILTVGYLTGLACVAHAAGKALWELIEPRLKRPVPPIAPNPTPGSAPSQSPAPDSLGLKHKVTFNG